MNAADRSRDGATLDDLMADIAEEVQAVDLRDRVRRSSRRLTVRRSALAGTAVFAAVIAVSGAVWAGLPRGEAQPGPPAGSPTVTAPTEKAAPTATPSSNAPTGTAGPASFAVDRPLWTGIPGTLYYVSFDGRSHLRALAGGTAREVLTPRGGGCALAVSPDGRRLLWGTSDGAGPGDLIVASADGSGRRTLLRGISCQGGNGPFWLPDSRHLLVSRADAPERVLVDALTGAVAATPLAGTDGYVVWSPSGTAVAYQVQDTIVVARPDGSVVRRVRHGDETPVGGFSLQGISDDGRRAVVGFRNTDPSQVRSGFRLVDTVTGRNLPLPGGIRPSGDQKPAVYPLAGGQFLIRVPQGDTHRLYLVAADGAIRDRATEPPGLAGSALLLTPGLG